MCPLAANYQLIYLLTDDNWWLRGQSQHGHLRCGHLLFIKDFIRVYLNKFQQMYTNQSALDNMMLGFVKKRKGQAPAQRVQKANHYFWKNIKSVSNLKLGDFCFCAPTLRACWCAWSAMDQSGASGAGNIDQESSPDQISPQLCVNTQREKTWQRYSQYSQGS